MFDTNSYFEGNVASIAFDGAEGKATLGVMAKGEYTFATSFVEVMTPISGAMTVLLPGETEWKTYKKFESFVVDKDVEFQVKVDTDTPYQCLYK